MNDSLLKKKIYGVVLGGAIGDAFGAPVENMHYKDIEAKYGRVEDFINLKLAIEYHIAMRKENKETKTPYQGPKIYWRGASYKGPLIYERSSKLHGMTGLYTDDTHYRLAVYSAMIKFGRRLTTEDSMEFFIRLAAKNLNSTDERVKAWAQSMFKGSSIVTQTASPPIGAGWGSPGGVMNPRDPEQAARDGSILAAAVAEAKNPDATVESVIQAVINNADSLSRSFVSDVFIAEFKGRVEWIIDLAKKVKDMFEIREPVYKELLIPYPPWHSVYFLEMIPVALAMFYLADGDPRKAIIGSTNFGRDCDSIACIAGEISGAFKGIDALPEDWVETVCKANPKPDLKEICEGLTDFAEKLIKERGKKQRRLDTLLKAT